MAAKTAIKEPKRSSALVRRETFASYCFLLPSLIFFLGFVIYPMVLCVVTSFFDSTMNRADIFVGLANYKELFTDPIFLGALKNTFIIVVVSVPVTCAFSLWVSSAIVDLPEWATSLFRCVFYLPVVTGSVAVTVVWKWMYNNYYGIFNYLGKTLGLIDKNINWLGDERFALGCIILILLTTSVGQPIVLYVSALGNVDQSIVEAAEVDGATDFQCFWKIKWPAIMPTTLYVAVITTIKSPSKVMEQEVGIWMARGIGSGFTKEMRLVNAQMADAIDTSFDVPQLNGSRRARNVAVATAGGKTVNLTIYTQKLTDADISMLLNLVNEKLGEDL